MSIAETARAFFDACETGQGWAHCEVFCHPDAGFSCQSDALADVTTLQSYAEWMKNLLGPIPDGHYELRAFAADEGRQSVVAAATFHGTHTADGPVPATGNTVASDYAYVMDFTGDRISHMTKIWNDRHALQQLGWA